MDEINVILNGRKVAGRQDETVLQLADRHGIHIPRLCHDPRLKPISSCFICVVEIEGANSLKPSCSTRIYEGLNVTTDNKRIHDARKTVLEMLLSRHYADCLAPCKQGCPADVDAQGYISLIEKGLYRQAVGLIKETNPLPAICGRVCIRPCENACRRNLVENNEPVGICHLKRFAADHDLSSADRFIPDIDPPTGKRAAVIGSGPAGLASAYFLRQKGHQVDLYEAKSAPGGMLRFGIPEFRLAHDVVEKEIQRLTEMGIKIYCRRRLGENLSYRNLKDGYHAVILTVGSQSGLPIGCGGEDAPNVLSWADVLQNRDILGKIPEFTGKIIAVVGSDTMAVNCARTAVRLGAKKVYLISPRKSLTAHDAEIQDAQEEGINCLLSMNPTVIHKDQRGYASSMTCQRQEDSETSFLKRLVPFPWRSKFRLKLDAVIAATGRKTVVDFLDDINDNSGTEKLKVNEQGNIVVNKQTFQTGIKSIFAAGDAVSVAGNVIRAIAQAKSAAESCHRYLTGPGGRPAGPEKKEFLSKKNNLKRQSAEDYTGFFALQNREEMPKGNHEDRWSFREVERGYQHEKAALREAERCLECGCTEYHDCALKNYATEYGADQKRFAGPFHDFPVRSSHPFIEIDNNKCILCLRCLRICQEVVGANALNLVNRGIQCYIAPSMETALSDTNCESCGLCISACPTGAVTENVPWKPLPVKLEKVETVCNYCSAGEEVTLHHRQGFFVKVTGKEGILHPDGNFCKQVKFGYRYLNDKSRLTRPLLKTDGEFREISFDQAYRVIVEKIKSAAPDENAFLAGARLTNEEMYLIQKLARGGVKTRQVHSFHYLGRGNGYFRNSLSNTPFSEIGGARRICLIGSELSRDNAVVAFLVQKAKFRNGIPVVSVTVHENSCMKRKVDRTIIIQSYYSFVKALNYFLLANGRESAPFISSHGRGYNDYKRRLLAENFSALVRASGIEDEKVLAGFAEDYLQETRTITIFSEIEVSANTSDELMNLSLISGKWGTAAGGLVALKEKNNSQGLADMGIHPGLGLGGRPKAREVLSPALKERRPSLERPSSVQPDLLGLLKQKKIKNLFVFGEDPAGCAFNKKEISSWLKGADFLMLQDHFMTETARQADLILPASFPVESGGSFTNTQKVTQRFPIGIKTKLEKLSWEQLLDLHERFGLPRPHDADAILAEAESLRPSVAEEQEEIGFHYTSADNHNRMFDYGCDYLTKYFDDLVG